MSKISAKRAHAQRSTGGEYARRRTELLAAAAMVFKDHGYGAATVDDVARSANMDRATVYYYFKGKKDLFREMVGEATNENVEMAERTAALTLPPREKLRRLIEALLESYVRHYPYLYVYLQEDMGRLAQDRSPWSVRIKALNRRFDAAVLDIVQEGLDSNDFQSKGDAKLLAAGIVGMCNWTHRWFDPSGPLKGGGIAQVFADMILNGLEPRSAPL